MASGKVVTSARVAWGGVALSGAMTVMLGAYAAHGMAEPAAGLVDTGVRYQMWHTLALLALLMRPSALPMRTRPAMVLWALGMTAFSGSLYAMAFTGLAAGLITPLGGLLLMAGWLALGVTAWRAGARRQA